MKKFNISPKGKKIAVLTGALIVCGGVLAVVLANTNASAGSTVPDNSSSTSSEAPNLILVAPIEGSSSTTASASGSSTQNSKAGTAFDPRKESSRSEPLTSTVSKPTTPASKPPKPVVEGDSKNGSKPTNPVLTDKTKKPTYTTPPKAQTPTKKKSSSSTPSKTGGDHAGEAYDPVFGYSHGTGGQGTTVGNSGDKLTGNKVGIMD